MLTELIIASFSLLAPEFAAGAGEEDAADCLSFLFLLLRELEAEEDAFFTIPPTRFRNDKGKDDIVVVTTAVMLVRPPLF